MSQLHHYAAPLVMGHSVNAENARQWPMDLEVMEMEVPKVPAKQVTSVVRLANARIPVDSSTIVDINPPIAFNYPIIIKVFDCSSIVEKNKFVRQNVIHK